MTKYLKDLFAGKISKVTISQRVEKSPSVIVTSQYGHTANMERIMRAQTFTNTEQVRSMAATKTLELNPRHPIVIELNRLVGEAPNDDATKDLAYLLYDTALLTSGFSQDDPEAFADRMYRTIANSMNLKSLALADEVEVPAEEEEEEKDLDKKSSDDHDEF